MSDISITTSAVPDSGPAPASAAPSVPSTPPSDTGTAPAAVDSSSAETGSRPLTFAEALARREQADTAPPPPSDGLEPAATPGVPPIAAPDSPEDATADPNAPPAPERSGPIPFERHKAALENARTKAREEVAAQVQQTYGEHIRLGEAFRENPVAAAIQVLQELQQNPAYAPQLTSLAARMLAQRRGQGQAQTETMPEPDLVGTDANGQQVRLYSDAAQAKRDAWLAQRLMSQFRQELAPLQQAHQQAEAAKAQQAQDAAMTEHIGARLQAWRSRPGFREHEAALKPVQAQYVAQGHDPWTALGLAYADVVPPRLQAHTQTQFVANAARKAAGTTDNPATVAPTPPRRSRNFVEALARAAGETA